MYAVIETGGLQFKVEPGMELTVPRLQAEEGSDYSFDKILLLSYDEGVDVGTPMVSGAKVLANVKGHERGPKIKVFKRKRRKGYERNAGHRQELTRVLVKEILRA
ncbi:50S ribosomal protein L21 [Candidatus Fermentibacteria bacterium]|nr:50S ribosomal protein L21 [Candidatus Fermentibacteria bacterium]